MHHELRSETTDRHGDYIGVADFSSDSAEEPKEGVIGEDVVEVAVGEEENTFLFFVHMVDFDQFHWQNDIF